ncbi:hypothetical protein B0A58_07950 [Flavobacterium branchiophilum NBRC 15030 = ATCC 35035]|uniref:Uncharacterized protein DUF2147 n=1 Tax=Flavobacterium branchiophilum TaxID=55197 RepID=A0A543G821_9FLAO|nr:DUF2147 domain-containing protein [Flavobacterium branchiophilum]OXA75999.1 hypothetical protein B0A58_07950 [Flavobacterium branchiophilum NBRC 15030 = ATCC 35035]TQM42104.1 uncharacterized protein DUF2147 [Flavobacterium branchiophilum]GEM53877.1 hypothetical protein FB1_00980 [Flavobacterium branchiophilum NBRC 15030 = ATCC 35035]
MKHFILTFFLLISNLSFSQHSIVGKWKTHDDKTNKSESVVEIYAVGNAYYGKIIDIFNPDQRVALCKLCTCADKDKPVLGLIIIKDLVKSDNEYDSGKITDPKTGNVYKCKASLINKDQLKIRGYIGFALMGRSQIWTRVK